MSSKNVNIDLNPIAEQFAVELLVNIKNHIPVEEYEKLKEKIKALQLDYLLQKSSCNRYYTLASDMLKIMQKELDDRKLLETKEEQNLLVDATG